MPELQDSWPAIRNVYFTAPVRRARLLAGINQSTTYAGKDEQQIKKIKGEPIIVVRLFYAADSTVRYCQKESA